MTLHELCKLPACDLEKITDKQLEEIFRPLFNVTRPTQEQVERGKRSGMLKQREDNTALGRAAQLGKQFGVDIKALLKDVRKMK